ncbi:1-acyl-sn-glycerol-3-phosphate acyltransferase [Sorangium sp. So ce388]|uniref:1-acyl-sn-glycerol-3-phosphate acyltransferase n=1 Tax=Sorangium sp. So ce388 TaxID=3133309 RepID=UPI003F5BFC57
MLNDPDSLENRDPRFIKRLTSVLDSTMAPYHRTEVRGLSRIPRQDGLIYVGNHNGYPYMSDFWLFTAALFNEYGISRFPYVLAHKLTIKLPLLNQIFTRYGCVRASGQCAGRVLERGFPLLLYPGAEVELMRPHRERTRLRFNGRTSHIRLAMKYGVPIVPVVSVGSHSTAMILDDLPWLADAIGAKSKLGINAWPLMLSIPWGLTLGPFIPPYIPWPSRILIEVLEPMVWAPQGAGPESERHIAACAAQVEQAIVSALARLEAERMTQERPPLEVLKGAFMKALSWIEAHIDALSRWLVEAGTRLLGLSGRGEAQRAAPSDLVKVASQLAQDVRHDVDLLREMQRRSERNAAAVSRRTTATRAARKPRFTEREINEILAQARKGKSVQHVCDELGISASTFYRWRSQHTGRLVHSG